MLALCHSTSYPKGTRGSFPQETNTPVTYAICALPCASFNPTQNTTSYEQYTQHNNYTAVSQFYLNKINNCQAHRKSLLDTNYAFKFFSATYHLDVRLKVLSCPVCSILLRMYYKYIYDTSLYLLSQLCVYF
jgi:hypothetical protein